MRWRQGMIRMGFPSIGSWVTYGLGSETQDLPAFVVHLRWPRWSVWRTGELDAGFMPAMYQGTVFRPSGAPIVDLQPPKHVTPEEQRSRLDLLEKLNRMDLEKNPGNSELAARIESYELAYRMQGCAPEVVDLELRVGRRRRSCTGWTTVTEPFGRQCLMARRLVERGVRFVAALSWRARKSEHRHVGCARECPSNHTKHAAEVDLPISGLLTDLRARGLLDSTLVMWQASSAACRFRSEASGGITIRAR